MKRIKLFCAWLRYRYGRPKVVFEKGSGFYIPLMIFGVNPYSYFRSIELKDGRKVWLRLVKYEAYRDPPDMVKWSQWAFVSKGKEFPLIHKCSFTEFRKHYSDINTWEI